MKGAQAAVIFDLDGTLVDSNYQHAYAWWRVLSEAGHRVPMRAIHKRIGMGGDQLLEELIGHYDQALGEARAKVFKAFYRDLRAFAGAARLLKEVSRHATVTIATSASSSDLEVLLGVLDAGDAIDHVTSADDVDRSKPSPDVFVEALRISGVPAGRAIAVGDTGWDVAAARRIGLECICVETGGWGRCELREAGAGEVYRDAEELLHRLDESRIGELLGRRST